MAVNRMRQLHAYSPQTFQKHLLFGIRKMHGLTLGIIEEPVTAYPLGKRSPAHKVGMEHQAYHVWSHRLADGVNIDYLSGREGYD